MKALIVDDDPEVVEALALAFNLLQPHCAVFETESGEAAVEAFFRESPDLVVLDILLPEMDGYEVLRRIRQVSDVPVIMLTVKEEEMDKVKALGMGADDYIVKPFGALELLARIKAIERRRGVRPEVAEATPLVCGDLRIDFLEREVTVAGQPVRLTPTEYSLLVCLARSAGRVVPARTLLTRVWGPEYAQDFNTLKTCVGRLRGKLERDPSRPPYILTERGVGYRLVSPIQLPTYLPAFRREPSVADYRTMWTRLGLDLEEHDALLRTLAGMHEDIFVSQKNRPQAMAYFDSVVREVHGQRIRELVEHRANGGKVVGLYCVLLPEELVLAAGAVPVALCKGMQFPIAAAEEVLPGDTCPLIKSCVGFQVGRTCPYAQVSDFVVGDASCDGKKKMLEILATFRPTYAVDVPHKKTEPEYKHYLDDLHALKAKLEAETGVTITAEKLARATTLVNAKRWALQYVHNARRVRPAPISGLDALLVTQISFYDDPTRFGDKVDALRDELVGRIARGEGAVPVDAPRILVSAGPIAFPDWKLHRIIEDSGAVVVGEESCTGTRYYSHLTEKTDGGLEDQLKAIANRQLEACCACFTPEDGRLEEILELARDWAVDGVVHCSLRFCHTFASEAAKVEKALARENIPLLRIETDYSEEDVGELKTRVGAFLQMIRR